MNIRMLAAVAVLISTPAYGQGTPTGGSVPLGSAVTERSGTPLPPVQYVEPPPIRLLPPTPEKVIERPPEHSVAAPKPEALTPGSPAPQRQPLPLRREMPPLAPPVAAQTGPASLSSNEHSATPRVFIHYERGSATDFVRAGRLAEYLSRAGYTVADIRAVPYAIRTGSVRYFFGDDQSAAGQVVQTLRNSDDFGGRPDLRGMTYYEPKPRNGTIEVWIPSS